MKRLIGVLAFCAFVSNSFAANLSSDIRAIDYGDRTSTNLTNIIAKIGTRSVNLFLDDGDWLITTNITFPTNVNLVMVPPARLSIATGKVVTVYGNFEPMPLFRECFTGTGTATGTAKILYRPSDWGDATQYNIGTGVWNFAIDNTSNGIIAYVNTAINNTSNGLVAYINTSISTYSNFVSANYISTLLTNATIAISTNDTYEMIKAKVAAVRTVDANTRVTFDWEDGVWTLTNNLAFFGNIGGAGEVYILGNTSTPSSCAITISTSNSCFVAQNGGKIDWIDGFKLIGSTTNVANIAGVHAFKNGTINCGSNMIVKGFTFGYAASQVSWLSVPAVAIATNCGYGFAAVNNSSITAEGTWARNCNYGYYCSGQSFALANDSAASYCNNGYRALNAGIMNATDTTTNSTANGYVPATNEFQGAGFGTQNDGSLIYWE